MKKRLLLLPALLLLFTFNLVAKISPISGSGDKLNVWLLDGLQLKESAATKSKTIATLPYGSSVTVIKESTPNKALTVDFKSDAFKAPYKLKGKWIRVNFNGKTGYVFDGYLSAMPVLHKNKQGNFEQEEEYLKRNYGVLKIQKSIPKKDTEKKIIYYKNGAVLRLLTAEGCVDVELNLKNITLNEAVLFQKIVYTEADAAQNFKIAPQKDHSIKISYYACD
jgi:uncharacterized protein YgiM (DUF1202 family)